MNVFVDIGQWIASNESLLSGMAAMIVLAGVILSPIGSGLRRLGRGQGSAPGQAASARPSAHGPADAGLAASPAATAAPRRITFQDLTKPSPYPTLFARSDGVRIAYNVRGTPPPTIVCAPGIISHLHINANFPVTRDAIASVAEFARVVTFDKRGQGLSDPTLEVPSLDERTRDIEAVMDAAGVDRAVLMGFSEGGPMCLQFAHVNPDRVQGLVIVGSTARWLQGADYPIGLPRRAMERMSELWGTGRLRSVFFPTVSRDVVDDDTYRAFEQLIATRTAIRQLVAMMLETDVRAILPEIRVPTLVVHFTGDLAVPIRMGRAIAEAMPNAEFLEVNAVDHADLSTSPEAVARIRAFCEQVAGAAETRTIHEGRE